MKVFAHQLMALAVCGVCASARHQASLSRVFLHGVASDDYGSAK